MSYSHFVVNEKYLKEEKVSTHVLFWVCPKEFEEVEVNDNICTGHKEVYIFHRLKAGYYVPAGCKSCNCDVDFPFPCSDEILGFVKKLYPGYDFFCNKDRFKNYFRRKKCVGVDECPREKKAVER